MTYKGDWTTVDGRRKGHKQPSMVIGIRIRNCIPGGDGRAPSDSRIRTPRAHLGSGPHSWPDPSPGHRQSMRGEYPPYMTTQGESDTQPGEMVWGGRGDGRPPSDSLIRSPRAHRGSGPQMWPDPSPGQMQIVRGHNPPCLIAQRRVHHPTGGGWPAGGVHLCWSPEAKGRSSPDMNRTS